MGTRTESFGNRAQSWSCLVQEEARHKMILRQQHQQCYNQQQQLMDQEQQQYFYSQQLKQQQHQLGYQQHQQPEARKKLHYFNKNNSYSKNLVPTQYQHQSGLNLTSNSISSIMDNSNHFEDELRKRKLLDHLSSADNSPRYLTRGAVQKISKSMSDLLRM